MKSEDATYTGFQFEVAGYPALAVINKDLGNGTIQAAYPSAVFVDMVPDACNDMGHPTETEYDHLVEMEKEMIAYLEGQTKSVHVGHVTQYRLLQAIFYTAEPEKAEDFLTHYASTAERTITIEVEHDPEWEHVSAFYEALNEDDEQAD